MEQIDAYILIPIITVILEIMALGTGAVYAIVEIHDLTAHYYLGLWCLFRFAIMILHLINIVRYLSSVYHKMVDKYNYIIDFKSAIIRLLNCIITGWGWYIFTMTYTKNINNNIYIWFNVMLWYDTCFIIFILLCFPICVFCYNYCTDQ